MADKFESGFTMALLPGEEAETVSLAGFEVAKAELFAHTREPAVTIWDNKIKFNMACLRRFPGVRYIQILIHPEEKRLIIRPCTADDPDSLRWGTGGSDAEIKNRDMKCEIFAAKVFELMGWKPEYKYKMLGKPAIYNREALYSQLNSLKGRELTNDYIFFDSVASLRLMTMIFPSRQSRRTSRLSITRSNCELCPTGDSALRFICLSKEHRQATSQSIPSA